MSETLNKIDQIKKLRRAGYSFRQIANECNVSAATAHKHGASEVPIDKVRFETAVCGHRHGGLSCMRHGGHRGVHLSDENGRLKYWE